MASEGFHESPELLTAETKDFHRAIQSLIEELEAVDWYQQRVDAASNPELKEILAHNRDEEKEHAAMVLEWIRRRDAKFDEQLRTYLFTTGRIVGREKSETGEGKAAGQSGGGMTFSIGSLKSERGGDR